MNNASRLAITVGILIIVAGVRRCSASAPDDGLPPGWQHLTFSQIAESVEQYDLQEGPAKREVRMEVSTTVWNQCFADDQRFKAALQSDRDGAFVLLGELVVDLPVTSSQQIRNRLLSQIKSEDFVKSLSYREITDLWHILDYLRVGKQMGKFSAIWANSYNSWHNLNPENLTELAAYIDRDNSAASISAIQLIFQKAWDTFLGKESFIAGADYSIVTHASVVFSRELTPDRRAQLAEQLARRCQNTRGELTSLSAGDALPIVQTLRILNASDDQVAKLLVNWAIARDSRAIYGVDEPNPSQQFWNYERMLERATDPPSFSKEIRDKLYLASGSLGPTSGELLAFVAWVKGDLPQWEDGLKARLKRPGMGGDERVAVLLALANAMELADRSVGAAAVPDYAIQALNAADSDNMRLASMEWLAWRLTVAENNATAQSRVQQTEDRMRDPRTIHQLNVLSEQLSAYEDIQVASQLHLAATQIARLKGRLALFQEQLGRAKALHRSEADIASLETTVRNTEQQLVQATVTPSP